MKVIPLSQQRPYIHKFLEKHSLKLRHSHRYELLDYLACSLQSVTALEHLVRVTAIDSVKSDSTVHPYNLT